MTLGYFVKVFAAWFHQPVGTESGQLEITPSLRLSVGAVSIAMIALGLFSDPVFEFLYRSATGEGG